jgi:dihydroorotate dehydrogenase electron transfer subunit
MKIEKCTIVHHEQISNDYFLLEIESSHIAHYARAGQFVLIQAQSNTTNPLLKVPLAIYDKTSTSITVLCRIRGQKTILLNQKKRGDCVEVLGPLGNSFDVYPLPKTAILMAGGCGIASLYLLAKKFREKNVDVVLLSGARCRNELIEIDRFKNMGCHTACATDDGSDGFKGNVNQLFLHNKNRYADFCVYAAGPELMLRNIAQLAKENAFDAQLSFESYMACGIGVCLGCAVKLSKGYRLCCQQGPVFQANELL